MRNILLDLIAGSVVVFTIANLIFLMTPMRPKPKDCDCDEPKEQSDYHTHPKEGSLNIALRRLGIRHNSKKLSQQVLEENPEVKDTEDLITLALKKIRENFYRSIWLLINIYYIY